MLGHKDYEEPRCPLISHMTEESGNRNGERIDTRRMIDKLDRLPAGTGLRMHFSP